MSILFRDGDFGSRDIGILNDLQLGSYKFSRGGKEFARASIDPVDGEFMLFSTEDVIFEGSVIGKGNAVALVSHIYDSLPEPVEEEKLYVVILKSATTTIAGEVEACCRDEAIRKVADEFSFSYVEAQALGAYERA